MPRISTDNYDTVASWNGSQDLFVVEQPDGTKVATPAMVKQFIEAGDFVATGEVKDGHGNKLADMAKSADVDGVIGDLSQTGLTGDNVAEQLATASGDISSINTTLNTKLTLVENKVTSTGTTLIFDTTIQADTMYLIAMSAPVTKTARHMKCSMIRVVDTTTNEISFGSTTFVVTVNNQKVTITNNSVLYGMEASLIKLT
jgi:hypothetical protein